MAGVQVWDEIRAELHRLGAEKDKAIRLLREDLSLAVARIDDLEGLLEGLEPVASGFPAREDAGVSGELAQPAAPA